MKRNIFLVMLLSLCFFAGTSVYAAVDVFVSIPPQKWLVDKVGGTNVETRVLVGEGQDPHTFEPTPRQMAALTKARIWFVMDLEFEEQLVKKVRQVAPALQIIDIADNVQKIHLTEDEDHDHDSHDSHTGHDTLDPHVWLSPLNLMIMAEDVSNGLSQIDAENSDVYSANLSRVKEDLSLLHEENKTKLAAYAGSSFYVFHPSFGYFASAYGLKQEAVEMGGKSPGPRQLSQLIKKARAENVHVIFVQPQFDPKSAKAVAQAIGGEVVPLNALAADVAENLKNMANKIEAALTK